MGPGMATHGCLTDNFIFFGPFSNANQVFDEMLKEIMIKESFLCCHFRDVLAHPGYVASLYMLYAKQVFDEMPEPDYDDGAFWYDFGFIKFHWHCNELRKTRMLL
ncbi:unnamed protein product [Lactuca virosa]|uniref:Uncharacterized protein n=1 Tax=Lactuca virosa TaxID=75947 RepID=A0AAU9NFQ3_9ASTR|nr:unnamed protein product [Lactuca virosa]